MFWHHSPCCPYPRNLSSRAPVCLHPRLHGGARTLHFWSAGLELLLLSGPSELSLCWRSLSVRNCFQDHPSALYQQGFTTRHIPCATPTAHQECRQELAGWLTPRTHSHHRSQRTFINHLICPSNPSHVIHKPGAWKLSSACTESTELSLKGLGKEHLLGYLREEGLPGSLCHEDMPCWPWVRLCALLTHAATLGAVSAAQAQSTKGPGAYSWCWKSGTYWSALLMKAFAQETSSPKVQCQCLMWHFTPTCTASFSLGDAMRKSICIKYKMEE